MSSAYVTLSVKLDDPTVTHAVDHDDGSSSYQIVAGADGAVVYLCGTPEQLGVFADAIVRAASQHAIDQLTAAHDKASK